MINIKNIIDNITDEEIISQEGLKQIQECIHKYRFFQIGYAILAKKTSNENMIKKATIYAADKTFLKKLIKYEPPFNICDISNNERFLENLQNKQNKLSEDKNNDDFQDIYINQNGYKQEILKKDKKNIYNEKIKHQREIIQNFIVKKNLGEKFSKETSKSDNEDLSIASYELSPELLNENLLSIYIAQGKIEEVLKIYKAVIEKNPEKGKFFDDLLNQNPKIIEENI